MNILLVGSGNAGSWRIRGVQLGTALGARTTTAPSVDDLRWADVIVLVKRALFDWHTVAAKTRKPIVWDALDFWRQPVQNGIDNVAALALLDQMLRTYRPALAIGATRAMTRAIERLGFEGAYLGHHAWSYLTPAPARDRVCVVGYEGVGDYLGRWAAWLREECLRRGWSFVINPPDLRDADIVVALRDGVYDGWMCREWKSGVKLVNAVAAGRPVITQESAAYREINPFGCTVTDGDSLVQALDRLEQVDLRQAAACDWPMPYRAPVVAKDYRALLERVVCHA